LRAETVVAARSRIRFVQAPIYRIAEVVGADVSVVAIQEIRGLTTTIRTRLADGTGVAVVTTASSWRVDAPYRRIAAIFGTRVAVVAGANRGSGTLPVIAEVGDSTRIAVVARPLIQGELATRFAVAQIVSAGVSVIAHDHRSNTFAATAMVCYRTGIPVVACALVQWLVQTPGFASAAIVGARIVIVTGTDIQFTITVVVQSVAQIRCRC